MKKIHFPFVVLVALALPATTTQAQIAVADATPREGTTIFPAQVFLPGLWQTWKGKIETERRELGPVMGFTADSYTSPIDGVSSTWTSYASWKYEGQIYLEEGVNYTFGTFVDNNASISIDEKTFHTQAYNRFTASQYLCRETGWHDIVIQISDSGGAYGVVSSWPLGLAFNTTGQTNQIPLDGWTQLVDPGDGSLLRTLRKGLRVSAKMRETDPTVMDVNYIVYANPETISTINVRALAFEDGDRNFAKVIRPETYIEGTQTNLGDGIAANAEHTLSWKVSSDWQVDLAKVKFEVMVMFPNHAFFPLHLITIPAADGHLQTTASVNWLPSTVDWIYGNSLEVYFNAPKDALFDDEGDFYWSWKIQIPLLLDTMMWLYASKPDDLLLENGVLYLCTQENGENNKGKALVQRDAFWVAHGPHEGMLREAYRYAYGKMGYRLLEGEELEWVNQSARLTLVPFSPANDAYDWIGTLQEWSDIVAGAWYSWQSFPDEAMGATRANYPCQYGVKTIDE